MVKKVWYLHDMLPIDSQWSYGSVPIEAAEINDEYQYRIVMAAEKGGCRESVVLLQI